VSKQLVASTVKVPSQKTLFFTKIVMLNELLWSLVNKTVVTWAYNSISICLKLEEKFKLQPGFKPDALRS